MRLVLACYSVFFDLTSRGSPPSNIFPPLLGFFWLEIPLFNVGLSVLTSIRPSVSFPVKPWKNIVLFEFLGMTIITVFFFLPGVFPYSR